MKRDKEGAAQRERRRKEERKEKGIKGKRRR